MELNVLILNLYMENYENTGKEKLQGWTSLIRY